MKLWRVRFAFLVRALIVSLVLPCLTHGQLETYDWSVANELYPGIKHVEVTVSNPRKMVINAMQIDTATPGLKFYTTGRCSPWAENSTETQRQRTRDFIRESQTTDKKLVVAINADAWNPWIPAEWDQQTNRDLLGLAVSEGTLVSDGSGTASLIIDRDGTVSMASTSAGYGISDVQTAVSGFVFCLSAGSPLPSGDDLHPRTGTGLSENGRYVYFMTIDGRQPDSEGATTEEVGSWLKYFGAYTGINMDGGGSTTMAWWDPEATGSDKCRLLNNPRGSGGYGISTSERCVGNNIGVYYVPEPSGLLFFLILVGVIAVSVVVVSLRRKEKALSGR